MMSSQLRIFILTAILAFAPHTATADGSTTTPTDSAMFASICSVPAKGVLQNALSKKLANDLSKLGFTQAKVRVKLQEIENDPSNSEPIDALKLLSNISLEPVPVQCIVAPCNEPPQFSLRVGDVAFEPCSVTFNIHAKYSYKPEQSILSVPGVKKISGESTGQIVIKGIRVPSRKSGR